MLDRPIQTRFPYAFAIKWLRLAPFEALAGSFFNRHDMTRPQGEKILNSKIEVPNNIKFETKIIFRV